MSTAGPSAGFESPWNHLPGSRVWGAWGEGAVMPSPWDFRRQADICVALSLIDPVAQDDANQAGPPSPAPTVTTGAVSDSETDSQ